MPHSSFHWQLWLATEIISHLGITKVKKLPMSHASVFVNCCEILSNWCEILRLNEKHSFATLCLSHCTRFSLPIYYTVWNEKGAEHPPSPRPQPINASGSSGGERGDEICRSCWRFKLMAYMWFSNQAARKRTLVCLLSVNRQSRYPLIILAKGNMGFYLTPSLTPSLSIIIC